MKRPHIVMLSRALPFHCIGGMEAVAWDLARQFAVAGVQVTLLTTHIPGRPNAFESEGVEVLALRDTPSKRYSAAWWRKSRAYFERNLMDSVTSVLSVSAAAYGVLPLKPRLPGVPFVFQAHGTSLGEVISKWRTLQPKAILSSVRNLAWFLKDLSAYHKFETVIAVGDGVYADLQHPSVSWVLPTNRVKLIRNGIDTNLFYLDEAARKRTRSALGWSDSEKVVVSACRLHKQKGVDFGLRAFAAYARKDSSARYLIIGDGPEKENLEKLTDELGIAEKVLFAGPVQRIQVADYFRVGDAFLFTTKRMEGLPLNVLEALAVGMPAVVSNHLQSVLRISKAVTGVDPRDEVAVARGLENSLVQGRGGKCLLQDEYTLMHCAREYYKFLIGPP